MFAATLFVLTMAQGPIVLNDTRGPYQTEAQCNERAQEMAQAVTENLSHYGVVQIRGKCEQNEDISV